jgi:hypothetical protein
VTFITITLTATERGYTMRKQSGIEEEEEEKQGKGGAKVGGRRSMGVPWTERNQAESGKERCGGGGSNTFVLDAYSCSLAKFRFMMIKSKYGAVIGWKTRNFVCA